MNIIILLFMIGAAVACMVGIIAFSVNGQFNKQNSNKLMRLRVLLQSIALLIVVMILILK